MNKILVWCGIFWETELWIYWNYFIRPFFGSFYFKLLVDPVRRISFMVFMSLIDMFTIIESLNFQNCILIHNLPNFHFYNTVSLLYRIISHFVDSLVKKMPTINFPMFCFSNKQKISIILNNILFGYLVNSSHFCYLFNCIPNHFICKFCYSKVVFPTSMSFVLFFWKSAVSSNLVVNIKR